MARSSWLPVLVCALAGSAAAQQTQTHYQIAGTVVDHRTKTPLASVMVTIAPVAKARGEALSVRTGADGSFRFPDVGAGKYALSADRRGQEEQQLLSHGQFSTAITTGPGVDSEHVVFPLFADGRISGKVIDDEGTPVQGAQVYLLRRNIFDGKAQTQLFTQENTTGSGAFHFGHLKAGTYYLAVSAHLWYAGGTQYVTQPGPDGAMKTEAMPPPSMLAYVYPVTFSGDTTEAAAAQPINLPEGGSVATQVNLHAVPSITVELPDDRTVPRQPMNGMSFSTPGRSYGFSVLGPGGVVIGVGGGEGVQLAPGTYQLTRSTPGKDGQSVSEEQQVTVGEGGVTVLSKTSAATTTVTANVTINGSAPIGSLRMALVSDQSGAMAEFQPNTPAAFPQTVRPGRYRVVVIGQPELQVQAVGDGKHLTAGDALVIDAKPPGEIKISVVLGPSSSSTFDGTVVRDEKPVAGAMVLLLPANLTDEAYIGRDQSDSDGTFSIPNVQPGRYALLALDCDQDDESCGIEYRNPAVMKPYLGRAIPVTVPTREAKAVQVALTNLRP